MTESAGTPVLACDCGTERPRPRFTPVSGPTAGDTRAARRGVGDATNVSPPTQRVVHQEDFVTPGR